MSDMVERARRIVAGEFPWLTGVVFAWAEALLAEHDARQEAEADSMQQAQIVARLGAQVDSLTARAEQAEQQRDAWVESARLFCTNADFWRERAEQTERERDEARARLASEFHDESVYGSRSELARRVATLEAALREVDEVATFAYLQGDGTLDADFVASIARAALGEQTDE